MEPETTRRPVPFPIGAVVAATRAGALAMRRPRAGWYFGREVPLPINRRDVRYSDFAAEIPGHGHSLAHGMETIVTLNIQDFLRFEGYVKVTPP